MLFLQTLKYFHLGHTEPSRFPHWQPVSLHLNLFVSFFSPLFVFFFKKDTRIIQETPKLG